jgi:hypothetical protein
LFSSREQPVDEAGVRLDDGTIQARNSLDYRALAASGPPLDATVEKETRLEPGRRCGAVAQPREICSLS